MIGFDTATHSLKLKVVQAKCNTYYAQKQFPLGKHFKH